MRERNWKQLDVIRRVEKGEVTVVEGAQVLGITPRWLLELRAAVSRDGSRGLAHGNAGRAPANRLDEDVRKRILALARTTYVGFNDQHFTEKLVEVEKVTGRQGSGEPRADPDRGALDRAAGDEKVQAHRAPPDLEGAEGARARAVGHRRRANAAKVGNLLGAKFLLVGSISRVGGKQLVQAREIDVETAAAANAQSVSFSELDDLLAAAKDLAKRFASGADAGLQSGFADYDAKAMREVARGVARQLAQKFPVVKGKLVSVLPNGKAGCNVSAGAYKG